MEEGSGLPDEPRGRHSLHRHDVRDALLDEKFPAFQGDALLRPDVEPRRDGRGVGNVNLRRHRRRARRALTDFLSMEDPKKQRKSDATRKTWHL
jgi:hypothetical protein